MRRVLRSGLLFTAMLLCSFDAARLRERVMPLFSSACLPSSVRALTSLSRRDDTPEQMKRGVGGDTSCIWTHYLTIFLMHATHLCAETQTFALVAVTLSGVISRQVQPGDGFGLDCANRSV